MHALYSIKDTAQIHVLHFSWRNLSYIYFGLYQCKSVGNSDFDLYLPFTWFNNTSIKDIFTQKMMEQTKR